MTDFGPVITRFSVPALITTIAVITFTMLPIGSCLLMLSLHSSLPVVAFSSATAATLMPGGPGTGDSVGVGVTVTVGVAVTVGWLAWSAASGLYWAPALDAADGPLAAGADELEAAADGLEADAGEPETDAY